MTRHFQDTLCEGRTYVAVSGWARHTLPTLKLGHVAPTDQPGPALELHRASDMSLRVVDRLAMDGPMFKAVKEET